MYGSKNEKWKEIFGEVWKDVTESCPNIGGFLIDHESGTVLLDENAKILTNTDDPIDYNNARKAISELKDRSDINSEISVKVVVNTEACIAGFFKSSEKAAESEKKSILPVCNTTQIVLALTQNSAPSLLALIELKMSDGSDLSEFCVFEALTAIIKAAPENTMLSIHSDNRFWLYIPNFSGSSFDCLSRLGEVVKNTYVQIQPEDSKAQRYVTFSAGIGEEGAMPAKRMNTAEFALYEATGEKAGNIVCYSAEQYETNKGEYEKTGRFLRLVNENLFRYHFQPIVSAVDGEIVAYEMLMRSDKSIGMFPLEILECAEKAKRLYDIEKATMSNALSIIEQHQDVFKKRKLFVNSITAHALTDEDWGALESQYGELMEKMVIEFTEQTEIDDQSLDKIRSRLGRAKVKLAIDDFGTGYSNTSNLIKYNPDYVKIDRSLIEGINEKPKMRRLVSGFIEFIHENGYQALAEGVETYEELQTMIQLGADLIQGFYTSKPKPIMLHEISDSICVDIKTINLMKSDSVSRPYHPKDGEVVDLCLIRADGYNSVFVETETATLKGRTDIYLDTLIMIKNGIKTKLTLENIRIKTEKDLPTISVGEETDAELVIVSDNDLDGRGIYVPQKSSLTISGSGTLNVTANKEDCYAIGVNSKNSPGNITINMSGNLNLKANGDKSIAIGGGLNHGLKKIRILSGIISIICTGRSCVGIGISSDTSIIHIENCKCNLDINAPEVAGIGSFNSNVDIQMANFSLNESFSGINIVGVGTVKNGAGKISMSSGSVNGVLKGRTVNCIGSRNGTVDCRMNNMDVTLYSESSSVSGIGDMYGEGEVEIESSNLEFIFRTGEGFAYGNRTGNVKCVETAESITINP